MSEIIHPCAVCGEAAAGFHFGAFTCEGCKSFFGRSCETKKRLECKHGGSCEVNGRSRTSCKSCRLAKCQRVGMSKTSSRYGRRSNWFKIHCLIQNSEGNGNALIASNIATPVKSASSKRIGSEFAAKSEQKFKLQHLPPNLGFLQIDTADAALASPASDRKSSFTSCSTLSSPVASQTASDELNGMCIDSPGSVATAVLPLGVRAPDLNASLASAFNSLPVVPFFSKFYSPDAFLPFPYFAAPTSMMLQTPSLLEAAIAKFQTSLANQQRAATQQQIANAQSSDRPSVITVGASSTRNPAAADFGVPASRLGQTSAIWRPPLDSALWSPNSAVDKMPSRLSSQSEQPLDLSTKKSAAKRNLAPSTSATAPLDLSPFKQKSSGVSQFSSSC